MNISLSVRHTTRGILGRCGFWSLAACTVMGLFFLAARVAFTQSVRHGHLAWNMFLAWVPYACSVGLLVLHERDALRRRPILSACVAATWLVFFPNAPYLVTDFVHLTPSESFAWWYDIGLIATFAWTGVMLGIVSLAIVQEIVTQRGGAICAWMVAAGTIALSGAGIYIGRFVRLNSWDVVLRPIRVGKTVWHGIVNGGAMSPRAIGVSIMSSLMLTVFYVTWRTARPIAMGADARRAGRG